MNNYKKEKMGLQNFRNLINLNTLVLPLIVSACILVYLTKGIENVSEGNGTTVTGKNTVRSPPKKANLLGEDGDYYTSLTGIHDLARKEQEVVKKLIQYRKKLNRRLVLVDEYLDDYSETIHALIRRSKRLRQEYKHNKYPLFTNEDDLEHVLESTSANPLMVFKLLRRFSKNFVDLAVEVTEENVDEAFSEYLNPLPDEITVPSSKDLLGAASGLLRIQETYQLPTHDMAEGRLIDKKTGCRLNPFDMAYIGMEAFNDNQFATAVQWLYQAYQRSLQEGSSSDAEELRKQLRILSDHHNLELLKFKRVYTNVFTNFINKTMENIPHLYIPPPVREQPLREVKDTIYNFYNFMALCRGETLRSPQEMKDLRCWYSPGKTAFHIISPFKVEMHSRDPPVYQVYELLHDNDISTIKKLARPHLRRSQVAGGKDEYKKGGIQSDLRTSSVAWLFNRKANGSIKTASVVEDLMGLEVEAPNSSEFLQISCYGSVGGYYNVHMDTLFDPSKFPNNVWPEDFSIRGDRIATVMFYLSDVELGGGTAFPKIGVAAKPIKGSAVVWYNLKYNGDREPFMLHGGCPVLYGNKWVANKWVRYNHQFQARKCRKNKLE